MTKIYTKTGDDGTTGLYGGSRVAKDDLRIEAYGTMDELNSTLGWARATGLASDLDELIAQVQHDLFAVGAELASTSAVRHSVELLTAAGPKRLEAEIDRYDAALPALKQFVLPAGTAAAAALHVARAVCRRAERRLVALARIEPSSVRPLLIVYVNRLADLLFVLSRVENQTAGVGDVAWRKP